MTETFLITGATGLIGFHVLLAALAGGHTVRFTARSEDKAKGVLSNPAVQKLAPGDRLSPIIIADMSVDGAFDSALQGVTHVIHIGSPVPYPELDPLTDVFQPMMKVVSGLLASAHRTPSVQRIVITSSIVANLGPVPPPTTVTAQTRIPLPSPFPETFGSPFEAYVLGRMKSVHYAEEFMRERKPHFSLAHVVPSYVYGPNRLMAGGDIKAFQTANSSNNFLIMAMRGINSPYPLHDIFAHVDDIAEVHVRVALLDPRDAEARGLPVNFAVATKVDYDKVFGYVEKAYPKAVEAGILKSASIAPLPVQWGGSESEKLLGRKLRSFESAVVELVGQYLDILGVEKA